MMRKMIVVLRERVSLPRSTKPEPITHVHIVYADTKQQAVNITRQAGHKGDLLEVLE
jgi:hypothetical protein